MEIVGIVDEGLGHSSHLVDLGDGTALVVDPARFPTRQRTLAVERGLKVAWTADTHSHADYITGSPELASDGAVFLAPAAAGLELEHRGVRPGETVTLSEHFSLQAIPTPGHTPDHLAYLLRRDGEPVALFSGGSLMVGTVGRTDLLGPDQRERLARQLYAALQREILTLPDDLAVYPTHGAGSFCSAPGSSARSTTIGQERATNPLLHLDDEDHFVEELLAGFGSFPPYFGRLPELNRRGPRLFAEPPTLPKLRVHAARAALARGAMLVDARPIDSFARSHPLGAISIALRPAFASWLGWLVAPERPIVVLLDAAQDRYELVRQAFTVGYEQLLGEIDGGIEAWTAAGAPVSAIPLVGVGDTAGTPLDVRQASEWASGHVPGARHVELGSLPETPVPPGPLTVMCGHGERAMTAASVLAARGHEEVTVFDGGPGDWVAATGQDLVDST